MSATLAAVLTLGVVGLIFLLPDACTTVLQSALMGLGLTCPIG